VRTTAITTARTTNQPTGYLLHETDDVVVIATTSSSNRKTSDMIQIWILTRNIKPTDAVRTGQDELICGDCSLRGQWSEELQRMTGRACYVTVCQAPVAIWKKYQRGGYPYLPLSRYPDVFCGHQVRFGAYGDPALIPLSLLRWIAFWCDGHTGYTHQWRSCDQRLASILMASIDSEAQYQTAKANGWRTFRVRPAQGARMQDEITCPASEEAGHRTTCDRCLLCSGSRGKSDPRKDIVIQAHGAAKSRLVQITL